MLLTKNDEEIRQDVLRELTWDKRINQQGIDVISHNGTVILKGRVAGYAERLAAHDAARRVRGVVDVDNEITVGTEGAGTYNDRDLLDAVRHALEWDIHVRSERVEATVSNGWVSLCGTVESLAERDEAERTIQRMQGIQGIINQIKVVPPAIDLETHVVRDAIEEALGRHRWKAGKVDVKVAEGKVTLSGAVTTWTEKRAVVDAVSHAPGIHAIDDQLHIEPEG